VVEQGTVEHNWFRICQRQTLEADGWKWTHETKKEWHLFARPQALICQRNLGVTERETIVFGGAINTNKSICLFSSLQNVRSADR